MKIYVDSLPEDPFWDCPFFAHQVDIKGDCILSFCDCKTDCPLIEFPQGKDGETQ